MRIVKCNNPLKVEDVLFSGNSCNHRNLDNIVATLEGDNIILQVSRVKYICTFDTPKKKEEFCIELILMGIGFEIRGIN